VNFTCQSRYTGVPVQRHVTSSMTVTQEFWYIASRLCIHTGNSVLY